jgi:hypothetical protein
MIVNVADASPVVTTPRVGTGATCGDVKIERLVRGVLMAEVYVNNTSEATRIMPVCADTAYMGSRWRSEFETICGLMGFPYGRTVWADPVEVSLASSYMDEHFGPLPTSAGGTIACYGCLGRSTCWTGDMNISKVFEIFKYSLQLIVERPDPAYPSKTCGFQNVWACKQYQFVECGTFPLPAIQAPVKPSPPPRMPPRPPHPATKRTWVSRISMDNGLYFLAEVYIPSSDVWARICATDTYAVDYKVAEVICIQSLGDSFYSLGLFASILVTIQSPVQDPPNVTALWATPNISAMTAPSNPTFGDVNKIMTQGDTVLQDLFAGPLGFTVETQPCNTGRLAYYCRYMG